MAALGWVLGLCACYAFDAPHATVYLTSGAAAMWSVLALSGLHRVHWVWCAALYAGAWFASARVVNALLDRARLS